ncbi:tetratricopeptide repeat protein [Endozoicomonas arenosclerae]|uniref:tetratricopeptide repeat protein n=1 Tax=Endozoicomonas arenosclerae TaxID=1633495 RepID=UPI0007812DB9|nr:tetratricopeptide repeat protein [Endozoicomonas arenosclerae]
MNGIKRLLSKKAALSLVVAGLSIALVQPVSAAPKKAPELRKTTYKYLQKAQEQMAEDDYASAQASLEHALGKVKNVKFDKAAINQMLGVVYANQEQFKKALKFFKASLADDALHQPAAQQVRYNLAQLLMMQGEYKEGIDVLLEWMANLEEGVAIPARAWIMLANGYSRLNQWENVIEPATKAIKVSKEPPESWYTLLLAAHYELKDIPSAIKVLETLVKIAPQKKKYWQQLSGMNMSIKRDRQALAALRAAYRHGLYDKESDYTQLANFLTFRRVPYQAGIVYQDGLDKGVIEANFDNYKRLANFWSHAKESRKAVEAFYEALALRSDADLQLKLGRMLAQSERFDELLKLAAEPADGMKDKHTGEMLFLSGMAHYQLGNTRKSLELMRKAAEIKSSRGKANSWIGFLEQDLSSS